MEDELKKLEEVADLAKFQYLENSYIEAKTAYDDAEKTVQDAEDKVEAIKAKTEELTSILQNKSLSAEERMNAYDELQGQDTILSALEASKESRLEEMKSLETKITNVKELFQKALPHYAKILDEKTEEKMLNKIVSAGLGNVAQARKLEIQMLNLDTLYKNVKYNEEFKDVYDKYIEYPANCIDLLEKEVNAELTPEEAEKLKEFEAAFMENRENLSKLCTENAIGEIDFQAIETSLFSNPELTGEDHIKAAYDDLQKRRVQIKEEQDKYIEKFGNRVSPIKDVELSEEEEIEEEIEEPEVEPELDEEKPSEEKIFEEKLPGYRIEQESAEEIEEVDLIEVKPTLFARFKNYMKFGYDKVKNFFVKEDEEKLAEELEEEIEEENYQESFENEIALKEDEIEQEEIIDDREIEDEKIAEPSPRKLSDLEIDTILDSKIAEDQLRLDELDKEINDFKARLRAEAFKKDKEEEKATKKVEKQKEPQKEKDSDNDRER